MSTPAFGAPQPPPPGSRRLARIRRLLGRDARLPIDPDLDPENGPGPRRAGSRGRPGHGRNLDVLAAIGAGGFIGALGRYEAGLAFPSAPGEFPLTTFVINTSGAFVLGVILTLILERLRPTRLLRPFACVGVLGAWTTMSTLATESAVLMKDGHPPTAVAYMAATLVCGIAATGTGIAFARRREVRA